MKLLSTTLTLSLACVHASLPAQGPKASPTTPENQYPGSWNQWRGGLRSGHISETADRVWPERMTDSNLIRKWEVASGPSYSGPVVNETTVFTTATVDKEHEVAMAVDRETGKVLWKTRWDGAMSVPFFAKRNGSWIRSTPALDGSSLYVAGMRDVLVRLDADTGAEIWRVDFTKRFGSGLEGFGFVCSPLVNGDSVFVQTGAGLIKLDKETGETRWRALREKGGMFGGAFSSPVVATIHEEPQLLVQGRSALHGLDPSSGEVLWKVKVKTFRGMNILTPLPYGDAVFTSAYGGRGHLYEVQKTDGKVQAEEKWTNRVQAYMTSPVLIDGHAYVLLRSKRFCCFEMESGDLKWTSPPIGDTYWSLVAHGNKILALSDSGELYLIAANTQKFDVIDRMEVSQSETWAHLAIDGDQIFVRSLDGLSAFTWN